MANIEDWEVEMNREFVKYEEEKREYEKNEVKKPL